MAQEPAAGETLPAIVHLTVAEAGSSMFLSMLDYADDSSSCSTDDVVMNGQKFSDALNCRAGGDDGYTYAWALSKNVSLFEATIGVSDGAATDASARISIFGDNTLLYSGTVAHGVPQNVSVDTTGVLRLEIIIASDEYTSVYLGDATLIGPSDGIDALATTP